MSQVAVGQKIGSLLVLAEAEKGNRGKRRVHVMCDCGVTKTTYVQALKKVENPTCGCGVVAAVRRACTKHGMSKTRQYANWQAMIQRTSNPKAKAYQDYGGRGITVCESWRSFDSFYADMGACPRGMSLGRIDNDGPYCKENCRWETLEQQGRNKRNNHLVQWFGKTLPLVVVYEESCAAVPYRLVAKRVNELNWSLPRALWTHSRARPCVA